MIKDTGSNILNLLRQRIQKFDHRELSMSVQLVKKVCKSANTKDNNMARSAEATRQIITPMIILGVNGGGDFF